MHKHTPRTGESVLIDAELGFAQTTGGHSATGVGDLLDTLLGLEKLIELSAEGKIFPTDDFFGNQFENERSITNPSVEVVRVNGVWACDDDSGLGSSKFQVRGRKGLREVNGPLRQTTWSRQGRCWPRDPILRSGILL